jgi:hypothetical protein
MLEPEDTVIALLPIDHEAAVRDRLMGPAE